eukprot:Hpha_TRINITY_DN15948_c2_g3::TRINITY_DN15948_c2_g3_i1::g.71097::m.71097
MNFVLLRHLVDELAHIRHHHLVYKGGGRDNVLTERRRLVRRVVKDVCHELHDRLACNVHHRKHRPLLQQVGVHRFRNNLHHQQPLRQLADLVDLLFEISQSFLLNSPGSLGGEEGARVAEAQQSSHTVHPQLELVRRLLQQDSQQQLHCELHIPLRKLESLVRPDLEVLHPAQQHQHVLAHPPQLGVKRHRSLHLHRRLHRQIQRLHRRENRRPRLPVHRTVVQNDKEPRFLVLVAIFAVQLRHNYIQERLKRHLVILAPLKECGMIILISYVDQPLYFFVRDDLAVSKTFLHQLLFHVRKCHCHFVERNPSFVPTDLILLAVQSTFLGEG